MSRPNASKAREVWSYSIGYAFALALTGAAFALVHWPKFTAIVTLGFVLGLALVQMVVHFRFFLHISFRKSAREDLQLILFATLIIALMASGTLVILWNSANKNDVAPQSSPAVASFPIRSAVRIASA